MSEPTVTVLLPVLDEADHIDACLESLEAQDYTGRISIVVADGGSTDGTLDRLVQWGPRLDLLVLDNPTRVQSAGLNVAVGAATGEILVRTDAHTTYAPDYIRRSVDALLASDAVAVGGRLTPEGHSSFSRAVAAAMRSPLAIGPARFHHADTPEKVDTVYLGAFRRDDLLTLGGFRSFPSGAVEDADLYFRWRRQGRTVLLDPSIRSIYRPRETARTLARQFYRYGQGKAEMLYVNGRWPSWRPAAPLGLILAIIAFSVLGVVVGNWWPLVALAGLWAIVLAVAAISATMGLVGWLRTIGAAAIMHLAYGAGLLRGLLRRPASVRRTVTSPPLTPP